MSARSVKRALRYTRLASLACVSMLGAAGCASIIGLDDYTVAGGGGGGKSGVAGHAGAINSAGGEGGLAGSGEGGEGGEAIPPFVGCDGKTGFTPNAQVVRSCLLRAGCDPTFNPVRTVSTCVSKDTQSALKGEDCNSNSKTCADFEACEHVGVAHDDLCGGTKKTRCDGDIAVNCGNYKGDDRFFDCAALGGHCGTYTYAVNNEVYADCTLDVAPDTCTGQADSDELNFCHTAIGEEDLRYYCYGEQAYGSTCSAFAKCIDTPDEPSGDAGAPATGNASCFFNTDKCTGPDAVTCKNGVANVCSSGSLFKYDCASVGLDCSVTAGNEYCLAPACKPADFDTNCEESCSDDGSTLTFCYGGAPVTVTCTDYGFTQCLSDKDSEGKVFAACRF